MSWYLVLTTVISAAGAAPTAAPSAAPVPAPAEAPTQSAKEADAVVAAAFQQPPTSSDGGEKPAAPSSSAASLWLPVMALLALAATAFVLSRRKRTVPGTIKILETASLGPRRALVLAQVQGRTLLLGSSEAGIALLSSTPVSDGDEDLASEEQPAPATSEQAKNPLQAELENVLFKKDENGLFQQEGAGTFEQALEGEDQDLRAKLAAGMRRRVP